MSATPCRAFAELSAARIIAYRAGSVMAESMLQRGEKATGRPDTDAPTLADLLQRMARGERAAFRGLYDLTAPRLYAVALRITGERSLAADALHDAFMLVLKQAARFDPARGSAEAWLVSLARYRALDIKRSRRRDVYGYEPRDQPSAEPDPLERLNEVEEGEALRACLEQLDEDRRRLIVLAFLDGLSHNDLANRLNLPLGTVKSAIRRGLLALKECLGR